MTNPPGTDWQETIAGGEAERFERYAIELRERQVRNARGGTPARALHARQFYVDPERTPIEDPSVEWKEDVAPWLTVARVVLAAQDSAAPRGRRVAALIESLSFDPWHAPVEFRPLGGMMRARNAAYRESTKARGAAPEPDGSERLDEA